MRPIKRWTSSLPPSLPLSLFLSLSPSLPLPVSLSNLSHSPSIPSLSGPECLSHDMAQVHSGYTHTHTHTHTLTHSQRHTNAHPTHIQMRTHKYTDARKQTRTRRHTLCVYGNCSNLNEKLICLFGNY